MSRNEQKLKNERLTKLLMQYPTVFLDTEDLSTISLIELETKIINRITNFLINHNELGHKKHPTPKTIICSIKVLKTTFFTGEVNIDSERKLVERTYKHNKPKCYEMLSAVIIRMMLDAGFNELCFYDIDSHLSLNYPIKPAVDKLKQWICYDKKNVSSEFRKYFPNTVNIEIFDVKTEKKLSDLENNGWDIRLMGINENDFNAGFTDKSSPFFYQIIERNLKKQAEKYLLYGYLINKELKYNKRTVNFLRSNCVIFIKYLTSDKECKVIVDFKAPVLTVIHNLEKRLKSLSHNKEFTYPDFLFLLGIIAHFAAKKHYTVLDDQFYKCVERKLFLERKVINEMLRCVLDMLNDNEGILKTVGEKNSRKVVFLYKDYRLIFEGFIQANLFNQNDIKIKDILYFMINDANFKGDTLPEEKNHLELKYNHLVLFNTALLYFLDTYKREAVLRELVKVAKDFSVKNRSWQVKAIYMLSYYLGEDLPIPSALRKEIFIVTFGTSMYDFQLREVWRLFKIKKTTKYEMGSSTNFFIEFAKKTFFDSCKIAEDGYAESEPYFNFWIGFIDYLKPEFRSAKSFLINASKSQRKIWTVTPNEKSNVFFRNYVHMILQYLVDVLEVFRSHFKTPNHDILYYVYSANILFYSLADLVNMNKKQKEVLNLIITEKRVDDIIECCILCDYLTKKFNRCYNKKDYDNMYLLCGAFRLVCSYSLPQNKKYILTDIMKTDYTEWINNEKELRYIGLLYRLLSYTNYPIEKIRSYFKEVYHENSKSIFLKYDNIVINESFLDNPQILQSYDNN